MGQTMACLHSDGGVGKWEESEVTLLFYKQ